MFKEDFLKKYSLFIVIILSITLILLIYFSFPKEISSPPVTYQPPAPSSAIEEILKPGMIGEIEGLKEAPEKLPAIVLPPVLFDAYGTIKEVKTDRVIIQGDGTNFADQKPRALTLKIKNETVISEKGQKIWYKGIEGLKLLKPGDQITLQASENIRGKTEFFVDYINKI